MTNIFFSFFEKKVQHCVKNVRSIVFCSLVVLLVLSWENQLSQKCCTCFPHLSSLMQKHFQFKQRLNWVKRPAAGGEAPDFRLGGLIRPDPARHFYSTLSLLLLHTSQPNTSDAASLYKPPIHNGVEIRYEIAFEFHVCS